MQPPDGDFLRPSCTCSLQTALGAWILRVTDAIRHRVAGRPVLERHIHPAGVGPIGFLRFRAPEDGFIPAGILGVRDHDVDPVTGCLAVRSRTDPAVRTEPPGAVRMQLFHRGGMDPLPVLHPADRTGGCLHAVVRGHAGLRNWPGIPGNRGAGDPGYAAKDDRLRPGLRRDRLSRRHDAPGVLRFRSRFAGFGAPGLGLCAAVGMRLCMDAHPLPGPRCQGASSRTGIRIQISALYRPVRVRLAARTGLQGAGGDRGCRHCNPRRTGDHGVSALCDAEGPVRHQRVAAEHDHGTRAAHRLPHANGGRPCRLLWLYPGQPVDLQFQSAVDHTWAHPGARRNRTHNPCRTPTMTFRPRKGREAPV